MIKQKIKERKNRENFHRLINSEKILKLVVPLFNEDEYKGSYRDNVYKWKCLFCNSEFYDNVDSHVPRCKKCFPLLSGSSKLEKEIVDWLKSLNIEIIENSRRIIPPYELDIYIPSHNIAIEFNGLYHHGELNGEKNDKYHLNKTNMCHEKKYNFFTSLKMNGLRNRI